MTTIAQELTGRYVAAGGDRPNPDAHRMATAVFACDTLRTIYDAGKKFGIDPADNGSLAELVDAAEENLEHMPTTSADQSQRRPTQEETPHEEAPLRTRGSGPRPRPDPHGLLGRRQTTRHHRHPDRSPDRDAHQWLAYAQDS